MMPENPMRTTYWYRPYEGFEARCQRRLQEALGVDETAAEAILRLRNQVVELQAHIRHVEAELAIHHASQDMRLGRYREVSYEATWVDLEIIAAE
jgi:hypothetical protein